jgi:hypothetical protein
MRFDIHLRQAVRQRLAAVSAQMAAWNTQTGESPDVHTKLVGAIEHFSHTTHADDLFVGGVDGSGDFPVIAYGDSFVYATVATATIYKSDAVHGLREMETGIPPLIEFTWLSGSEQQRTTALFESFERPTGHSIEDVIIGSDYQEMRRNGRTDVASARAGLIVPPAHDAGNLAIQLRTTAELAAALRLIEKAPPGAFVFTDGTMTLPFVQRKRQSLFFDHLRRFCCVRARDRGVVFAALSKSHGLPSGVRLDEAAREKLGTPDPEHWFLRMPDSDRDGWSPLPPDGPRVPPVGAITYLVKLHRTTPIMRLDLDARFWEAPGMLPNTEQRLFEALDYSGHDQRCFGYPYPIKAAHDRASLTQHERFTLKKQVVDAAVEAGLKRSYFRDASQATGHA